MLKRYAYHRMLLCLISKHESKNIRKEVFLVDMNAVMRERDYAEALKS